MKNVKNANMGDHLLVEVYNVPFDKLNDAKERSFGDVGVGNTAIENDSEPELG